MTTPFATLPLPRERTVAAPDGSDVRVLLSVSGGSMAHFELAPGKVTVAVTHRTVDELWYVLSGEGQMWRRQDSREETVALQAGLSVSIPLGTHFQFRALGDAPLRVVAVTLPPWPGPDEAVGVEGPWMATVGP